MRYLVTVGRQSLEVDYDPDGRFAVDGAALAAEVRPLDRGRVSTVVVDGRAFEVAIVGQDPLRIQIDGREVRVAVADARAVAASRVAPTRSRGRVDLGAPMPGLVKAVHVAAGDIVESGAALVTLEAMKMENELRAPGRARVVRLRVAAGEKVERDALLVTLEPA